MGSVHFLMGFVGGVGGDAIRNSAQRSSLFPRERVLVSGMCGVLPFVPSCAESKIVHVGCIPDVSIPTAFVSSELRERGGNGRARGARKWV